MKPQSARAIFVTLEGPDGAGKSRQATRLAERLRQSEHPVVLTREPGGTDLGERVRSLLLQAEPGEHDALSDALLFNAARSRLVAEVIGPALEQGAIVICDRFFDSTLAYQGYGDGLPVDMLRTLAQIATGGLVPTRTVLVDVSAEVGLYRKQIGAASGMTRFEIADEHDLAFHERVRQGYHALAGAEPKRWRVIDGSGAPDEVAARIWAAVADLFV